ncbi:uncharacterized protein LOC116850995 [Odontomachus brunneus]|uniref:uncharacterized protein LOC116850995 n=1 Tax=Odontomachus brunneus TaxID=486640 RepID=UPI0013F2535F|nr:uncharacterized protein LOC116850995 [Odontomachus brunneus]
MYRNKIPEAIVNWTQSMLMGRSLTVSLVVDDLLAELKEAGFLVYGYADDVAIIARRNFITILKERMDAALRIVQTWCRKKGLSVNSSKTSAVVFTRKYKPEHIEPLKLWGREITYTSSVKYLGVILDAKLSWLPNLEEKRRKFYTTMWACRRVMGRNWGLHPRAALWLYRTVLLPRLTYAAVVWRPRMERVKARNLLKSLQGSYLRAVTGTMRTTPTEALKVALCCPSLGQLIKYQARRTAYRLRCQGEWKDTGLGHTRLGLSQKYPFMLKQDRIPRKHQLEKKFKVLIPTRDDWTNGLGVNGRYGVGIYGPKRNHRESIPLGWLATVFQAEVMAILRCAETLAVNDSANQHFYIFSDSRAAIHALAKTTTESAVVWDCMQALARLGESNKITLVWIPGHQGFLGNEIADELAKLGTQMDPATQIVGVAFVTGINIIRGWLEREHVGSWRAVGGCRTAKRLMEQPSGRANELLAINRLRLKVGLCLLTGHITLRSHLNKLGLTEQSDCRLCGEEREDSAHILCWCPVLTCKRYRSWGCVFMEPEDLNGKRVSSLINLVSDTRLGLLAQS